MQQCRVLSIQSHVTSGYVGNRSAVFPLQLLGYEVDILNSCMLSNHTGYSKGAFGIKLTGQDLTQVISGMKENGLLNQITHVLTGYIGNATFLNVLSDTIIELRKTRKIKFICDPVLGDNGKLYVPKQNVQIYADKIIEHATILTPNTFELSLLSGMDNINSEFDVFQSCNKLHDLYNNIETIFVTGCTFINNEKVSVLVSSKSDDGHIEMFAVEANLLDEHFTGTGDLISALILAWTDKFPKDLKVACSHAMASVTGVLLKTTKLPKTEGNCPFKELKLIQSQDEIVRPRLDLVQVRNIEPT